ncbi:MAG: DUF438 domain-containing protein [Vallitaleaceae bacterium]|nr:DUF438 domain-containing protein [Vallitaleaceae bacterium]
MSEFINNKEHRQLQLKGLIQKLHDGATVEEVRAEFASFSHGVTATEIAEMEQALVNEGLPVAEIQRLCDVHAAVFKGSIEEIHQEEGYVIPNYEEGHPVHTFKQENRVMETLMEEQVLPLLSQYMESGLQSHLELLQDAIQKLNTIDKHYKRKEHLIFPFMEKHGITAPPQVMWGVDDEIRGKLKVVIELLSEQKPTLELLNSRVIEVVDQINEMIFKEEEIMFPMVLEHFTQKEWMEIEKGSKEIGFTLLKTIKRWLPKITDIEEPVVATEKANEKDTQELNAQSDQLIAFDAGSLLPEEINAILNTLPLDMTFVDANNRVKYFTQGKERIFDRPKTIIGREVKNCHPPKSVHVVEQIVDDLRSGKKDHEDFWIKMGNLFVYIRYFAVRNAQGEFLGTLEITQNIKPIQDLEGEKRLMS